MLRYSSPRPRRCVVLLLAAVSGCASASNPVPSPAFDGRYVGRRDSHPADGCAAPGRAVAVVRHGTLTMKLFGPHSVLDGSVGADGTLRASGIWSAGMSLPIVTVLRGRIVGGELTGSATDLHCTTDIVLHRTPPPRKP